MDNFGSTQTFVTLTEDAIPGIVTRKLLDSYKSYWDYWKEDNSTNNFTWGSSLTRMDEIYFSPLNHYTPFRNGTRKQVQILLAIAMILLLSIGIIAGRQGSKVVYLDGHCQSQRNEERADHVLHDDEQAAEQLLVLQAEVPLYNIYRAVFANDECT